MARIAFPDLDRLRELEHLISISMEQMRYITDLNEHMRHICSDMVDIQNIISHLREIISMLLNEYEMLRGHVSHYRQELEFFDRMERSLAFADASQPSCKNTAETSPAPDIRSVEFSAIAPKTFTPGEYSMIDVVMYEENFRHIVDEMLAQADEPVKEKRSGIHHAAKGSHIKIVLSSPDIAIEDGVEQQVWQGKYLDFSFAVELPENYAKNQILFIASVYIDDMITTRLKFTAQRASDKEQRLNMLREDILSAFISYASQDRNRVASILQGMRKIRPDMDFFFDVDSLRSGEDWEKALQTEISRRDILYLCWSRHAKASKWVETEWRYALQEKGLECIEPVPIESPTLCPPPEELKAKHFNDKLLYIINAAESKTDLF